MIVRTFIGEDQSSRVYFRVVVQQVLIMESDELPRPVAAHVVTVYGDLSLANLDIIFSILILIQLFFDVQTASHLTYVYTNH